MFLLIYIAIARLAAKQKATANIHSCTGLKSHNLTSIDVWF